MEINAQMSEITPTNLATYIIEWIEERNSGELGPAFEAQTVGDRRLMIEELRHILIHGGRPPNWVG
jgi:hypothetical protein